MIDDRDLQLVGFLRDNAGRPYSIKLLCGKFGYSTTGSGSVLRKKLDELLIAGYPVRRTVAGRCSGALYCLEPNQLTHYASKLEERATAIMKKADICRRVSLSMKKTEHMVKI